MLRLCALVVLMGCVRAPMLAQPNVVIVSMDTLRADHLGAHGSTRGLTPNLDRFAAEAVVFGQAYAQAPETLFSHASLFTGRYPSELGPMHYGFRLPAAATTLAEVLSAYGYATGAFIGGGHLAEEFGFDAGFDTFVNAADWGSLHHSVPLALDWLVEGTGPRLAFVHGYDAHARYLKPPPFGHGFTEGPPFPAVAQRAAQGLDGTSMVVDGRWYPDMELMDVLDFQAGRIRDGDGVGRVRAGLEGASIPLGPDGVDHIRDVYAGAVAHGDAWFGLLMAGLEAQGRLDDTVVIVLADHGEELGEDGLFEHRFTLGDAVTHVPLMVRLPGARRGGQRHGGLVGLIDVLPTVVEAVGAVPPAEVAGASLWPAIIGTGPLPSREAVVSEGAFRMLSARGVATRVTFSGVSTDHPRLAELMDLASPDGPAWAVEGEAAAAPALKAALKNWRRATPVAVELQELDAPEALREALRARGYWGAQ